MIDYIIANIDTILMSALALVGLGAIIARYTPTPKDDTIFAFLYDAISAITPNDRKQKVEDALQQVEDVIDTVEDVIDKVKDIKTEKEEKEEK